MLDVIHAMFVEWATPLYENHHKVKERLREAMRTDLYARTPDAAIAASGGSGSYSARRAAAKPYIPVSTDDELMSVLGAPMGGD